MNLFVINFFAYDILNCVELDKLLVACYMYLILKEEPSWTFQHFYKTFYDVKTLDPLQCKKAVINDSCIPDFVFENDSSEANSIMSNSIEYWSVRDLEMYKEWSTLSRKSQKYQEK